MVKENNGRSNHAEENNNNKQDRNAGRDQEE